jgi:hypothetical protein
VSTTPASVVASSTSRMRGPHGKVLDLVDPGPDSGERVLVGTNVGGDTKPGVVRRGGDRARGRSAESPDPPVQITAGDLDQVDAVLLGEPADRCAGGAGSSVSRAAVEDSRGDHETGHHPCPRYVEHGRAGRKSREQMRP